jgi:hypothetical protein
LIASGGKSSEAPQITLFLIIENIKKGVFYPPFFSQAAMPDNISIYMLSFGLIVSA